MERYFKLVDSMNYGKIVKVKSADGKAPRAFLYNKKKKVWDTMVGFFFDYMAEEEDNNFGMYDEITEQEAKKYTEDFVAKAHEIARAAHQGQKDKAGVDYIKHPETVASFVGNDDEKAAAYLHDTLEDTSVTASDLMSKGIPEAVVEAVIILTHEKKENYFSYLKKVKNNPIARAVKLADLKHNSDSSRLKVITTEDKKRMEKYKKAQQLLA